MWVGSGPVIPWVVSCTPSVVPTPNPADVGNENDAAAADDDDNVDVDEASAGSEAIRGGGRGSDAWSTPVGPAVPGLITFKQIDGSGVRGDLITDVDVDIEVDVDER